MKKRSPRLVLITLVVLALFLGQTSSAWAQERKISLIRDAEIENTIRTLVTPLFIAAGLEPSAVKIYIVNDPEINAYVSGGQNIFINTGLLLRSQNASQLIGVIAHETGHIKGGHISRTAGVAEHSQVAALIGMLLGGAAIAATGSADLGEALVLGGQHIGESTFLGHSRTQEATADEIALTLLDDTKQSARGFYQFMKMIGAEEAIATDSQIPYFRTHPLTRDRLKAIRDHIKTSPYSNRKTPPKLEAMYDRMKAKLVGFLTPFSTTLHDYPVTDKSIPARYARSIAYYRLPNLDKALTLINGLIKDMPHDPYFYEMKGQMLFENRHPQKALAAYEKAADLLPDSSLIQTEVANVQIEMNDKKLLKSAVKHLRLALENEQDSPFIWHQLGIAYGRLGNIPESSLALGEEALLKGDIAAAKFHAGRAQKMLPYGSRGWLEAQDILQELHRRKDKRQ